MFSSNFFSPEYFNDHFKATGEITILPGVGGVIGSNYNLEPLKLDSDDEDILEILIAFTLSR